MNKEEHLQWCKDRALEYVESNDLSQAYSSMLSDMNKHEETRNHEAFDIGGKLLLGGHLATPIKMKDFINGFN